MDEKDLTIKFLDLVKDHALMQRDTTIPYNRSDLYQTKMFTLGVLIALKVAGYEVKKKDNDDKRNM